MTVELNPVWVNLLPDVSASASEKSLPFLSHDSQKTMDNFLP